MNTLSIFLYLANVIPNLGFIFALMAAVTLASIVFIVIATADHNSGLNYPNLYPGRQRREYTPIFKWLFLPVILIFLSAIIPSERTMYMIAASELGEVAVMNEEVQEVFDALKDRILIELRPQENTNN